MSNAPNQKLLALTWLFTGVLGFLMFAWLVYVRALDDGLILPYAEGVDFTRISLITGIGIGFCRTGFLLSWTCSIPGLVAQCKQFKHRYCYQWMLYSLIAICVLSLLMIGTDFILNSLFTLYPTRQGEAYGMSSSLGSWPLSSLLMLTLNFLLMIPGMAVYPIQFFYDRYAKRNTSPSPVDPFEGIETTHCADCGERIAKNNNSCPMCGSKIGLI